MEASVTPPLIAAMECPRAAIEDFEEAVRLHWPRVFRFALASLRDVDAAETVAQDCFLRAHRARDRFRGESSLDVWLMRIAVNLVRDRARSRKFQFWKRAREIEGDGPAAAVPDRGGSPESQVLLKEQVKAVWDAAGILPERQRTVFLLRFVEEMHLLEIAALTGMKEGTVKVHLFRAIRAVREKLGRSK